MSLSWYAWKIAFRRPSWKDCGSTLLCAPSKEFVNPQQRDTLFGNTRDNPKGGCPVAFFRRDDQRLCAEGEYD